LKKHTHAQRTELLRTVVLPMLRKELGNNLIAIAADGSYARDEDTGYSDLELMIFVKDNAELPRGFSKIYDGMLVEGLFITEHEYHKTVHEPNKDWYIAGSDTLLPVMNRSFVRRLQKYQTKNLAQKCDNIAREMLYELQESFGKLFTAIDTRNRENLFPILSDAVMVVLKLLAYINRKPYASLNSFMSEARKFKHKPRGLDEFLRLIIEGEYKNMKTLEKSAKKLYTAIEVYFKNRYEDKIYDDDLLTIYRKQKTTKRR